MMLCAIGWRDKDNEKGEGNQITDPLGWRGSFSPWILTFVRMTIVCVVGSGGVNYRRNQEYRKPSVRLQKRAATFASSATPTA
jgi:hypothetical protein